MRLSIIFCSLPGFTGWLQNHLLPCPFKKLTGIDCPGCGFQRSIIALLKGDFNGSLQLYPATLPIIFTALFVWVSLRLKVDGNHMVKKTLYILTSVVIISSYILKMYKLYK